MSLIETAADVVVGFCGSVLLAYFYLPVRLGAQVDMFSAIDVTLVFTVWAVTRKYSVRRFFERFR